MTLSSNATSHTGRSLAGSFGRALGAVGALWFVKLLEWLTNANFGGLGIYPRSANGLLGIVTSPLVHGDLLHLISNSVPFLLLCTAILFFYPRVGKVVVALVWLLSGLGVWLLARPSYHVGASGLVYGFAAFLFFGGLFRNDRQSLTVALLVAMLYGGMVTGLLPNNDQRISWESHVLGAVAGLALAWAYRREPLPQDLADEWQPPAHPQAEEEAIQGYRNIETPRLRYVFKAHTPPKGS